MDRWMHGWMDGWIIIMFIVRKLSHNSDFQKGPEIIILITIITIIK